MPAYFLYRRDNLTLGGRTLSGVLYCLYRLPSLELGPACRPACVQHDYADPGDPTYRSDPRRNDVAGYAAASRTRTWLIVACLPRRETPVGKQLMRTAALSLSSFGDVFIAVLFLTLLLYRCSPRGA